MTRLQHCSHKLGVHPDFRGQGIAYHLKLAQREAVVRQGVRLATWTFDPLVSENAHLNIRRLGAISRLYYPRHYGEMRDALNKGLPSDRLEVEWWLTSQRVKQRLSGDRPALDLANYLGGGAVKINDALIGAGGLPHPERVEPRLEATILLLEIPHDVHQLKEADMDLALEWRVHVRDILQDAFEDGYIVTDFVHIKGGPLPRSYYVLSHGDVRLG
jgi:predicted GNAT superfamily acetyltransferase